MRIARISKCTKIINAHAGTPVLDQTMRSESRDFRDLQRVYKELVNGLPMDSMTINVNSRSAINMDGRPESAVTGSSTAFRVNRYARLACCIFSRF